MTRNGADKQLTAQRLRAWIFGGSGAVEEADGRASELAKARRAQITIQLGRYSQERGNEKGVVA